MIKYSIIIPTYNRASLLDRCLKTLVNQTYKCFEVLICDDGSTDNTIQVVSNYKEVLDIKYFSSINWGGPARPRNIGINNSSGEWICFLDSDDLWTENKLEIIDTFANVSIDFLYHKMGLFFENGITNSKKLLYTRNLEINVFKDLLLNGNVINNSSVVVKKEIILKVGGISESKDIIGCEDYNTWLKIACITNKFLFIPKVLGYYDLHLQGLSRKDMSIPHSLAVNEFLYLCSNKEKLIINSRTKYMKVRYLINLNKRSESYVNLFYCLRNGTVKIKIKSCYYLFKILVNYIK